MASGSNIFISSHVIWFRKSAFCNIFILKELKNFKTKEYISVGLPGTNKNVLLIENVLLSKAFKSETQYSRLSL